MAKKDFLKKNKEELSLVISKLRYGFDNKECLTGQEVASMYNITEERVGQIEKNAFETIRKDDGKLQPNNYVYK